MLDPDQLKDLYFTLMLPSFSMSHENVKFLSPLSYIDPITAETRAILDIFGNPKIEIQVPLDEISKSRSMIKFNLRSVANVFEIA